LDVVEKDSACTKASSFDLTTEDLRNCLKEVEKAVNIITTTQNDGGDVSIEELNRLKGQNLKEKE
jgi:hypothetical protein